RSAVDGATHTRVPPGNTWVEENKSGRSWSCPLRLVAARSTTPGQGGKPHQAATSPPEASASTIRTGSADGQAPANARDNVVTPGAPARENSATIILAHPRGRCAPKRPPPRWPHAPVGPRRCPRPPDRRTPLPRRPRRRIRGFAHGPERTDRRPRR